MVALKVHTADNLFLSENGEDWEDLFVHGRPLNIVKAKDYEAAYIAHHCTLN